ncbi:MAG: hypothetical protein LBS60_05540 [Deltaproteobacteria bacterium]|nr:hypothetical protein [Deltaproteobacteria bacterium]
MEIASELCINLLFMPFYSPNLNLIERFWKHINSKLSIKHFNNFYCLLKL